MKHELNHALLAAVFSVTLATSAWAGWDEGVAAYNQTAFPEFKALAEQGDLGAQGFLGIMYKDGLGVAKDYKEAMKWFRMLADQGFAKAQTSLGRLYAVGSGQADSGWQYTRWGMSVDEVRNASGGKAVQLDQIDSRVQSTPKHIALLKARYEFGKFRFITYFRFDRSTESLSFVSHKLLDASLKHDLIDSLQGKYGQPRKSSSRFMDIYVWRDEPKNNLIGVIVIGNLVKLEYQDLRRFDQRKMGR